MSHIPIAGSEHSQTGLFSRSRYTHSMRGSLKGSPPTVVSFLSVALLTTGALLKSCLKHHRSLPSSSGGKQAGRPSTPLERPACSGSWCLLVLVVLVGRHVHSLRRVRTGHHARHRIRGAGDHLMLGELEELRIGVPLRQRRGSSEGHERTKNCYPKKLPHLNSSPSCLILSTQPLRISLPATCAEHSRTGPPSRSCYFFTPDSP